MLGLFGTLKPLQWSYFTWGNWKLSVQVVVNKKSDKEMAVVNKKSDKELF